MSKCKEHGTIYVEYGGNIGAPSDGYCYQCEIDLLKAELEEAKQSKLKIGVELDKWRNRAVANRAALKDLERQLAEAKEHMRLAGVGPYKANYTIEGLTLNGQLAEARAENETLKSVAAEKVVERAKLADLLAEASAEVERLIIQRDFAQSELQDVITTRFEARREVARECIEAFEAEYGILGLAFTLRQRFGLDEE